MVYARLELDVDVVAEAGIFVRPGFDRKGMSADTRRPEGRAPTVVVPHPHRDAVPFPLVGRLPQKIGRNDAVPIREYVGLDAYALADEALRRKAASVDGRRDL